MSAVLTWEEALKGVVQGHPGAVQTLYGLKSALSEEDYARVVLYLYNHGPRGPNLWRRYADRCNQDSLLLGRDLLAQASEQEGWD